MAGFGKERSSLNADHENEKSGIARSASEISGAGCPAGDNSPRLHDGIELGHGILEEDHILARRDKNAVEYAFNYSKLWCKFCKEVVCCMEKRGMLENDYVRSMGKQYQALETSVSPMLGVPLRSETLIMSRQMAEHCKDMETHNCKILTALLEVLNRQRTEFARTHKFLKDKWKVVVKNAIDAETALGKARIAYHQRCASGVKLRRELAQNHVFLNELVSSQGGDAQQTVKQRAKVEKMEKQLTDNDKKEIDSMVDYKEKVETGNCRLHELEKAKIEIICDVRLTTRKSDEVFKDTLAEYFQHLYTTRLAMLEQYNQMSESMQDYPPCREYRILLDQYLISKTDIPVEKYSFEAFHESSSTGGVSLVGNTAAFSSKERLDIPGSSTRLARISSTGTCPESSSPIDFGDSDEDTDISALGDCRPPDALSTSSASKSGNVLSSFIEFGSNLFRPTDTKKMSVKSKRSTGEMNSGPEVTLNSDKDAEAARSVIVRCARQIEQMDGGITTHGIYRVPASKLKVSGVMEALTANPIDADLSEELPLTLSSVIKNRLIQLPEPLLTYHLYPGFVELGKDAESEITQDHVKRCVNLIQALPTSTKNLAGLFFHHLKRVTNHQSDNQMGAANLGTMFGPTLLRPKAQYTSTNMLEFVDNKPQTRVVELIIENTELLFGPADFYYNLPLTSSSTSEPASPELPMTSSDTSHHNVTVSVQQSAPESSSTSSYQSSSQFSTSSPLRQRNTPTSSSSGISNLGMSSPSMPTSISSQSSFSAPKMPGTHYLTESQRLTMQRREAFLSGGGGGACGGGSVSPNPTTAVDRRRNQHEASAVLNMRQGGSTAPPTSNVFDLDKIKYMDTTADSSSQLDSARIRPTGSLKTREEQRRISSGPTSTGKNFSVETSPQFSVQNNKEPVTPPPSPCIVVSPPRLTLSLSRELDEHDSWSLCSSSNSNTTSPKLAANSTEIPSCLGPPPDIPNTQEVPTAIRRSFSIPEVAEEEETPRHAPPSLVLPVLAVSPNRRGSNSQSQCWPTTPEHQIKSLSPLTKAVLQAKSSSLNKL